ncbi:hypothetical protein Tco_0805822 [Tanacetum coccineum]
MTQLAQASSTQSLFNEFLATLIDFSAFIMNRLKLNNLTQDVLTGPTYDLMKGTPTSVVELEYHLEEVFKATNDQLDWHNPEGRPYPHDLSKPLPLIQNARGRQVIPFDHFINNDLEYLKGGRLSQKYTTSLTKTKATNYGHVKWIEDKVPRSLWSPAQVVYDKHDYWGTYHWGTKRQRFYGFATNMETSKDVYSRHKIIDVTSLKIMEFFGYKHLEEITVRRQDDQLYKFREGDFIAKTLKICYFFLFKDLQLAVESYQKKINLSRPDSYRSDLRKMTPYTAYHNIQGIIYQDDMDINRLMRTDELHKFSDGTLNHVRTALNDIANGIHMEYFPKIKWSKQDKQRARVMINAIDKKLRDRRFDTSAGNPVKEILFKLNLPDHRILKDGGEVKEFQERCNIKAFKSTNQERYEHVGLEVTSLQHGKVYKMAKRDYAWLMISRCSRSQFHIQDKGTSSNLKSMITTSKHKLMIEVKRAQD